MATAPFDEPFPTPEYPPAEWFTPPTWVAAYREEQGLGSDRQDVPGAPPILKLTVTDEGRIGGWFYEKGQCIVHMPDACPKPSPTGYAAFHQNDVVLEGGLLLRCGVIGNTHGHASPWINWQQAQKHYADPDAQMIVCLAGDDERGGWVAGALVPGLTYGDVALLRRCSLSGDWRPDFGPGWWKANGVSAAAVREADGYDCVGPTLVTRPGLPLPTAGLRVASAEGLRAGPEHELVVAAPIRVRAASTTPRGWSATLPGGTRIVREEPEMGNAKVTFPDGTELEVPIGAESAPTPEAAAAAVAAASDGAVTAAPEDAVPPEAVPPTEDAPADGAVTREEFDGLVERVAALEDFASQLIESEAARLEAAAAALVAEEPALPTIPAAT